MKVWLLCVALCSCVWQTAQGCSCVQGSFDRPRTTVIRDGFCYSSMVYTATVVGATCNCIANPATTLNCAQYEYDDGPTIVVSSAGFVATGECQGATYQANGLDMCADLSEALSVPGEGLPANTDLPVVNLTALAVSGSCPNVCPFNNNSVSDEMINPCQYTVELVEVFKPANYTGATTITVLGPDVLTSCGDPGRRLALGRTYLAGVGGACSRIEQWSTLDSYSSAELELLRMLRATDITVLCGALASLPSLLTLTLSALFILVMGAY